jgi:hypothetical protein
MTSVPQFHGASEQTQTWMRAAQAQTGTRVTSGINPTSF